MKTILSCFGILLSLSLSTLYAQSPPPNLNGEGLKDWLRTTTYTGKHVTLGYSTARSYMYGFIDNKNNTLTCVYSGYEHPWTYGSSGTNPAPINCEHTVPQSFFNSADPMVSDIHHLFPSYNSWNSTRGNYPLVDINDSQTTKWMYLDQSQSSTPTNNIDAYSEYYTQTFEPRESHKGDAARAIFYFYTMYPNEAGDISQAGDPATLYLWSEQDPITITELERNDDIEFYQGNRNPFVDYPNAIADAWGFNYNSNAPSMPSNFTVNNSSSSVSLSWSDTNNESGYYLYRSSDNSNYTLLSSLSSNTTSYTDNAVSANTIYYYYLTPYNTSGIGISTMIENGSSSSGGSGGSGGSGAASELLISEYIEGSSYNKGIEIANFTGSSIDLSNYDLRKQTNGAGSWSSALTLSGNLADGEVYVVINASSSASMIAAADLTTSNSVFSFNGNDPVGLFKNGMLIDIVGIFNGGSTNFAANQTLVRNADITAPNTTYNTGEWIFYSSDEFSYLGSHTINSTPPPTCDTPTNLASTNIGTDAATLSWSAVSDALSYSFRYRVVGTSSWTTQTTSITSLSLSGLTADTDYECQVSATCSQVGSNYSTTLSFTTDSSPSGEATELFISEYIEGSSYNKGIEIANFTGSTINLSAYDLRKQTNGAGSWSSALSLSGTIASGDVFVVVHSSANSSMQAVADLSTSSIVNFNGNDPVGLFKNGTLIDIVGIFNGGSTSFAANQTLVRNASVTSPNTTYSTSEWDVYSSNETAYLGSHNINGGGSTPVCDSPTGLSSSAITESTATISWAISSNAIDYTLQYRIAGTTSWSDITTSSTSTNLSNLTDDTTYECRISSNCTSNSSDYSNTINFTTLALPSSNNLFISEYIEGTSNNKGIEIVNLTGSSVNLSAYDLRKQTNGSGSWSSPLSLSGTLSNGDVFVVVHSSANSTLKAVADLTSTAVMNFNGNDPIGLFHNGTLIDIVGTFNGGSSSFAANKTLVRKSNVLNPNTTYTTSEWTVYSRNTFTYLGSHNTSGTRLLPLPLAAIKVYPNPSFGDLNIDILNDIEDSYSIRVIDYLGRIVLQKNTNRVQYQQQVNLQLQQLDNGIYFIHIKGETIEEIQKIILTK